MEQLTEGAIKLLVEIEETARKGFAVLGEDQMRDLIDHVVVLRQQTAPNEGALTHMYIPNGLGLAKAKNISPDKIRELIRLGEYVTLDQAAECIIQFRLFHKQWLQMIVGQQIYESELLEQNEPDRSNNPASEGFSHQITISPGQASTL
ncbi:MAG: hypothetical protein US63_C0008G0004 [Candidatus Moranbacteria bacterium GW2011_GWC2_37_8]|nr:MAG: hypothetical protein US63_C0008G0004 [Candidatus Moranbacteria bacterium GW2011_GWC2_37_8]KKQ62385.1 MAG: hypothetical protein US82_C0012G0003 [Parcubacteria group bacterium GW2011_GWC1_38_22]